MYQETTTRWMVIPSSTDISELIAKHHGDFHHNVPQMMEHIREKENTLIPNVEVLCAAYRKNCAVCKKEDRKTTVTPFRIVLPDYPLHHVYIDISFLPNTKKSIGMVRLIILPKKRDQWLFRTRVRTP